MVDGYIIERDRIFRRRKKYEEKREIKDMILRGVKIDMERRMRREESVGGEMGG